MYMREREGERYANKCISLLLLVLYDSITYYLAPGNRFLVSILKPSGCRCTDGQLTSRVLRINKYRQLPAELVRERRPPTPVWSASCPSMCRKGG